MSQSLLFVFEFATIIAILSAALLLKGYGHRYLKERRVFVPVLIGVPVLIVVAGQHIASDDFLYLSIANLIVVFAAAGVIMVSVWKYYKGSAYATESPPGQSADQLNAIKMAYFDFAPVIMVALDTQGHVVTINKHGCTVVACSESDILLKNWFDHFVSGSDREDSFKMFHQCRETHEARLFRSHIRSQEGALKLIQWKCGVDENTNLVLYVGEDITEREAQHTALIRSLKKVNTLKEKLEERVRTRTRDLENINIDLELQIDERKLIEDRLINSQRLYSAIAHNFPDGLIAVLDLNLNYLMIDGRELPVLGLHTDELLGTCIFEGTSPLLGESSRRHMERVLTGGNATFEIYRNSSAYSVIAVPLYGHQEIIYGILLVLQNITERKNLEQSLYKAIAQEKKLNDLKSRFVTMASHEFRTPLSTILSSLFLLESYSGALYEENKQVHINRIKRTVNMLTETLNDFLRLGKLEEGRVEMRLHEINIQEYADDVLKEMQSVTRPGQVIHYHHEGTTLKVVLDQNLLRSIFLNLLSNAVKYSPEGAEIFLETFLSKDRLVINVIDHGIGIAPEEQEHIFQRFFRAFNATNIEGTGLGLHIIKKYVEMMNGTINFSSDEKGTTFIVTIPLQLTPDNSRLILI